MAKKILFVSESLGRGGLERVLVDITNTLAKKGYDVTVLLYGERNDLINDVSPAVHIRYVPRNPLKLRRKLPYFHRFYNKDKWEKRASARTLYRYYVGREKYDVEIGFYRGPSIKIVSGSPNKKSKKLAWVHTDFKLCNPKSITKFFNNLAEVTEAYNRFDQIACVSNQAKASFEEVIKPAEGKTTVVYNMVSAERILRLSAEPCPLEKKRFTVATVGRLIPDKGFDRLISAVDRLNHEGYSFDVRIVGGGQVEEELHALAKEKKTDNVIFTGMQENPYKYLKDADLFICSSVREGFSIACAEALLLGLPVVSTRCTGPTEILEDGRYGLLVDNSEEGIYSGLKSVLDGNCDLEQYRKTAYERGMDFDKEKIAADIIRLIED